MDLQQFSRRMGGYKVAVTRVVSQVVREVATVVEATLVHATPVDTGEARSNWKVSLNQPDLQAIPPHAAGHHLGLGETANAEAAIEAAGVVIQQTRVGDTVWIQNNTFYIGVLNDGHSAQAPALFVEAAVQAGVATIKGANITLRL